MDKQIKRVVSTKLTNATFWKLEEIAESANCSNSEIARRAIQQYLQADEKDENAEIIKMMEGLENRMSQRTDNMVGEIAKAVREIQKRERQAANQQQ